MDPEEGDEAYEIAPVAGLRWGADIYDHFQMMLAEAGGNLLVEDVDPIATEIDKLDPKVADHFRRAEYLLRRRTQRRLREKRREIEKVLGPFRQIIEDYCSYVDDTPRHGGGNTSRASERTRVRAFLEDYVRRFGKLPTGFHTWTLSNGWLSGSRDFGDLSNG